MPTHPDSMVHFYALYMILSNHSDASYLSDPKENSQAGGHFNIGNKTTNQTLLQNGAIPSLLKIFQNVITSASKAEIGDLFENAKESVTLFHAL